MRARAFSFFTHLFAAMAALPLGVIFVERARSPPADAAAIAYAVALVVALGASALHHLRHFDASPLRWLDLSTTFALEAGTLTPLALLGVGGPLGLALATLAWVLALTGAWLRLARPRTPRRVTATLHAALALLALALLLLARLPWPPLALFAGGGLVLGAGALAYAAKRPDPWPRVIGYHGLWHATSVVGLGMHATAVWLLLSA